MRLPAVLSRFRAGLTAAVAAVRGKGAVQGQPVPGSRGWYTIWESFAGAWQNHVAVEPMQNLLTFSAVFACVSLISSDIAKLRIRLMEYQPDGTSREVETSSPFWPVLRKPNGYQTRIQFIKCWIISKLLYGNMYALKERDQRGVVVALYILDPQRVTPLVTVSGDVYYQLAADNLSGLKTELTVPASEIIHDRGETLYHPLVGVSPITACAYSATQGIKIQRNSATFFDNMSRPSGILTAPGRIPDEDAARLKKHFEENFSGANIGRVAVAGNDLKYTAMTMPAEQAQLIDQLKWTVEDVARCFKVPLHMIGAAVGQTGQNFGVLSQAYYTQTLQLLIEEVELLLDEGLKLDKVTDKNYGTEFDLEGLQRLDTAARFDAHGKAVKDGWMAPNEARAKENLPPVTGGETPYLQHQNYSLAALAKRDAKPDPFATEKPATPALPAPAANDEEAAAEKLAAEFLAEIKKGLECLA